MVFPHLRAKIWENILFPFSRFFLLDRRLIGIFVFVRIVRWVPLFFHLHAPFQMIHSLPYRISSSFKSFKHAKSICALLPSVPGAFTEMSEVNLSVPGCLLVCLIFSYYYCFICYSKRLLPIICVSIIDTCFVCLHLCVSRMDIIVMMSWWVSSCIEVILLFVNAYVILPSQSLVINCYKVSKLLQVSLKDILLLG